MPATRPTHPAPPSAPPPHPAIQNTLHALGAQWLVRGWLSANNIVFGPGQTTQQGATLVDTGYHSHATQTVSLISQALRGATLAHVVNTHLHSDHCGGNALLARHWPDLRITVPSGYRAHLLPWNEAGLSYQFTDQPCEPFTPHHFVGPGDLITLGDRAWEVHAAPGHDPDAVLLFEPQSRTLITGDALWEKRLAIIFPELVGEPGFDAAHQALDLIERLRPALVLPGHGEAFCDVDAALNLSRQRLNAFAAAPMKHRQHAARALVVFHMLEHRARPRAALLAWIVNTPVFRQTLHCVNDDALANTLATETINRLLADGVLLSDGDALALA